MYTPFSFIQNLLIKLTFLVLFVDNLALGYDTIRIAVYQGDLLMMSKNKSFWSG